MNVGRINANYGATILFVVEHENLLSNETQDSENNCCDEDEFFMSLSTELRDLDTYLGQYKGHCVFRVFRECYLFDIFDLLIPFEGNTCIELS